MVEFWCLPRPQVVAHPVEWLATLTAGPLGLGSNPGEDMNGCKCIRPSQRGGTLNSRRAASFLMRWVEGEERPLTIPRVFSKIRVKPS
ncbi:uncharacterized protein TNCV_1666691 [Trichonephila clavipes]|nr:uncharacterized protein TNCV_1666691 [Trichonephila clavipes]